MAEPGPVYLYRCEITLWEHVFFSSREISAFFQTEPLIGKPTHQGPSSKLSPAWTNQGARPRQPRGCLPPEPGAPGNSAVRLQTASLHSAWEVDEQGRCNRHASAV